MDKQPALAHQQVPQLQQLTENGFTSAAMEFLATQMPSQKQYLRRINKPLVEKKRRARINSSLQQLKTLVVDALNKTNSPKAKLEKADILEMTVRYVRNLQRTQCASSVAADPDIINKYRAGFNACVKEVCNFMMAMEIVDPDVKARLLDHLATTIQTNLPTCSPIKSHQAKMCSPLKGVHERNVTANETRGPLQTVQMKASTHRREPAQTVPNIRSLTMEAEQQQQQLMQAGYQVENVSDTDEDVEDTAEPNWREIMQATFGHDNLKLMSDVANSQSPIQNVQFVSNNQKLVNIPDQSPNMNLPGRRIPQASVVKGVVAQQQQILNVQPSPQEPKAKKPKRVLGSTACQIISIPPPSTKTSIYCDPVPAVAKPLKSLPVLQTKYINTTKITPSILPPQATVFLPGVQALTTGAKPTKKAARTLASRRPAASTVTLSQVQKTQAMTSLTTAAMNAYAAAQPQTIAAINAAKMVPKLIKIKVEGKPQQPRAPLETLKFNKLLTGINVSKEQSTFQTAAASIDQLRAQLVTFSGSLPEYQNFVVSENFQRPENMDDEDDESVWRPW